MRRSVFGTLWLEQNAVAAFHKQTMAAPPDLMGLGSKLWHLHILVQQLLELAL
jgi:hypothetical protein